MRSLPRLQAIIDVDAAQRNALTPLDAARAFFDGGARLVQVRAKQFNWEFTYPGPDGKFGTPDDKTLTDELHVPVGKPVRINLGARDVIHSLFVPQFRFKQDAVPGREIPAWFQVSKPGKYEAPCAELCGFGHSGMKGWVTVSSPDAFKTWVGEKWPAAATAARSPEPSPVG